jgi:hypothetical protein
MLSQVPRKPRVTAGSRNGSATLNLVLPQPIR